MTELAEECVDIEKHIHEQKQELSGRWSSWPASVSARRLRLGIGCAGKRVRSPLTWPETRTDCAGTPAGRRERPGAPKGGIGAGYMHLRLEPSTGPADLGELFDQAVEADALDHIVEDR